MRDLNQDTIDILFSKNLVGSNAPTILVNVGGSINTSDVITGGTYFTNVEKISMSKERNTLSQKCTITLVNVNPDNPFDFGYYNPLRDDTAHNKPSNSFADILLPNESLILKGGYGTDLVAIFTGTIDTVKIDTSDNSKLIIVCRDTGKLLVDSTIKQTKVITESPLVTQRLWYATYPIATNILQVYLADTVTDPYLWEIFADVCVTMCGLSTGEVIIDGLLLSTIVKPTTIPANLTLKLSDVNLTSFQEVSGTAINLCNKIAELLNAELYCDEYGIIHLEPFEEIEYEYDDDITLTGTTPSSLTVNATNKDRAVKDSIVVGGGTYTEGDDWEFDEQNNTIVRTNPSDIPDGTPINIQYSYANWIFKNGRDIKKCDTAISHDDYYYEIIARNTERGLERNSVVGHPSDGSTINTNKILIVDVQDLTNNTDIDNWLSESRLEMARMYWDMKIDVIPLLHLQVYDLIQPLIYGTIQGIYRIHGINLSYSSETGYEMSIVGIFYKNP